MTLGVGHNLALRLDRLAALLAVEDRGLSVQEIGDQLGYHKTMTGSLRSWARHLGLIDERGRRTAFALAMLSCDPDLGLPVTRALLYAQLATNPDAEMFFFLVNDALYHYAQGGEWFHSSDIESAARVAGVGGDSSATRQHRRELRLMLQLLTSGAFGDLRSVDRAGGRLRANPIDFTPSVVAYVLAASWPANTAFRSFTALERPGGLARIALVGRTGLRQLLRAAEHAGFVVVEEEASLNRVARVGDAGAEDLVAACYGG